MSKILTFYGDVISQNRTKTPEGYLIAVNCPLARTGWYEYLGSELGLSTNDVVKVYRSPDEVFSKASIASFNGKSITDDHPPELVISENNDRYEKGTVINVRRGIGNESNLLLGDLIIKDPILIREIESNIKREISCGYECEYVSNEDGTYSQVDIRGNHVAVVEAGRAGHMVAIKDSKNKVMEGEKKLSKKIKIPQKKGPVTNFLEALGLKHYAADAEPEEIANTLDQLVEERGSEEDEDISKPTQTPVEQSESKDENPDIANLTQQVSELTKLVGQLISNQNKEKAPEEAIDEIISKLEGENTVGDEEESVTVPVEEINDEDIPDGVVVDPEDRPQNPIPGTDSNRAMAMALKAMKPIIANMSNPVEKKKACDSLLSAFKATNKTQKSKNGYAEILKSQKKNAMDRKKAEDERAREAESIGENYKKQFNPHYKEVK